MIHTVFCPAMGADWQAELLGFSWARAQQPGELVQLNADTDPAPRLFHPLARAVTTQSWVPHPYTGDPYPPYQRAASVLEWLFVERVEGSVLLLDPTCAFRSAVVTEVEPGGAQATEWTRLPEGEGPLHLGSRFAFLSEMCVDRSLEVQSIRFPVLIHATELRRLVPRWLELISILRAETARQAEGPIADADTLAYAIAAAEARIPHAVTGDLPFLELESPTAQPEGEYLGLLNALRERQAQGSQLSALKPQRQRGVRDGKVLGSMFLEIPGRADTISLNSSGAAIWEACDGTRTLAEINRELESRFDMPEGSLQADIEVVVKRLEGIGALRLSPS